VARRNETDFTETERDATLDAVSSYGKEAMRQLEEGGSCSKCSMLNCMLKYLAEAKRSLITNTGF
jgi:hypothetical protein